MSITFRTITPIASVGLIALTLSACMLPVPPVAAVYHFKHVPVAVKALAEAFRQ